MSKMPETHSLQIQTDAFLPWHGSWPLHIPTSLNYPDVPIWWILEKNLESFADRPAIRFMDHESLVEKQVLTYKSLASMVSSVAAGLQRLGIQKGDRIAFYLPNSPELVISYFAIWRAGAVAVPCNPMFRQRELTNQLKDAEVRYLIASAPGSDNASAVAKQLGIGLVVASDKGELTFNELLSDDPRNLREVHIDPADDLALILYTGGTTGVPKGAMLTHRNIVANTMQFAEWYAFEPGGETCISVLPLFHSGGMSGAMNVPLYGGATILLMSRFSPISVAKTIEAYRATRFFGVPTMFISLLNDETSRRCDYSSLKACRTNASPLPASVKAAFDELVGREVLIEGYGLTETSPLTHANPINKAKAGSIGIPLADTDAKIVDLKTGIDLSPKEIGEIMIRGPQVMKGYWNRREATAAAIQKGWLHTGDVAYMDEEGYFFIVDRLKDIINTAGYKVWPREVEEVLYSHSAVKLAAVVGVADSYRGEIVKAFVVLRESMNGHPTEHDIVSFCKEKLAAYKVPRLVEFRKELPVSGAGKILRRELRAED
ncbi:MAG: long-chain fatty acid--CoA ligase [Candidatus Binatia bacterium]